MNSLGKFILTAGLTLWTVATTNNKAISAQIKEVFETVAPDKKILKEDTVTMPDGNYVVSEEKKSDVSWYWGKFHGRKTASGAVFSNSKLTTAHLSLPFGTQLKVTNRINGKSVVVTVTDRGPFTKGRELDLSKRAFMEITDNKNKGLIQVDIEIVE